MLVSLREALVTLAAALLLAGAVSAAALPLLPQAWRGPAVPWGTLLGSVLVVALLRRRGRRR